MKSHRLFLLAGIALICAYVTLEGQSLAQLTSYSSGFNQPIDLAAPDDGSDRLFVAEQGGLIKIIHSDLSTSTFLDLSDNVLNTGERGLLGITFHPDYVTNGYIYLSYTGPGNSFDSFVTRVKVDPNDPDKADLSTEKIILRISQPYDNHNGGDIAFGSDGYLYIGMGDGGSGGDPDGSGQDLLSYLGKILRIDVDTDDDEVPYLIPEDNPFFDQDNALSEIWAWGLRNPWRFSFDRESGDIWIADVGQGAREEISINPNAQGGLNFGWRCFEGDLTFANCDEIEHVEPEYVYARPDESDCADTDFCGKSVTGGFVYRGTENPNLNGLYFFADYASNKIWTYEKSSGLVQEIVVTDNARRVSSFGESQNGELFVVSRSGTIYKVSQSPTSSIKDVDDLVLNIFPNPTSDKMTLNFPQNGDLQIAHIDGRVVLNRKVEQDQLVLDLAEWVNGTYVIQYFTDSGLLFKKVIKN